jgi:hypothetical protein
MAKADLALLFQGHKVVVGVVGHARPDSSVCSVLLCGVLELESLIYPVEHQAYQEERHENREDEVHLLPIPAPPKIAREGADVPLRGLLVRMPSIDGLGKGA